MTHNIFHLSNKNFLHSHHMYHMNKKWRKNNSVSGRHNTHVYVSIISNEVKTYFIVWSNSNSHHIQQHTFIFHHFKFHEIKWHKLIRKIFVSISFIRFSSPALFHRIGSPRPHLSMSRVLLISQSFIVSIAEEQKETKKRQKKKKILM